MHVKCQKICGTALPRNVALNYTRHSIHRSALCCVALHCIALHAVNLDLGYLSQPCMGVEEGPKSGCIVAHLICAAPSPVVYADKFELVVFLYACKFVCVHAYVYTANLSQYGLTHVLTQHCIKLESLRWLVRWSQDKPTVSQVNSTSTRKLQPALPLHTAPYMEYIQDYCLLDVPCCAPCCLSRSTISEYTSHDASTLRRR